jgi:MFS family permease
MGGPGAGPAAVAWSAAGAGFTVLFVGTGVNFAFGILFKSILLELGSDRSTLALAATASLAVNALGQPVFGALVDRFGPRRVILPSLGLMAVGTFLVAWVRHPWQLIVLYGVVAAFGYTGSGILPVSVHVTRWFPTERGFITAVVACGFSVGQLVFAQVTATLAAAAGWRRTYLGLAAILTGALALLTVWLRDAPRPGGPVPGASGPSVAEARRAALATPAFWWMTLGLMGCGFTDFLLTTHLPAYTTDLGLSDRAAANALSLWAAANIVGILLAGTVASRLGARPALVLTYLLRSTALFGLPMVRETWQLYLFALLFGATFFTTAPLSSTMVAQLFGPVHHGAIFGATNLFHHLAGAFGSYAGGLAFDLTGSYRGIFRAGALLVLGSAGASALARRRAAGRRGS